MAEAQPRLRLRLGAGSIITIAATLLFIGLWFTVLTGSRSLLGGDLLYGCCLPWRNAAGAHPPSNTTVGDPIDQFLPWRLIEGKSLGEGRLPLWNPYSLDGVPLLATGVSATLSPFTLLSMLFDPVRGMTIAMLTKLWVAGIGMALFLRLLRVRAAAAAVASVAYATSGFIVVWLGWPQSSIAALMPWAFAAGEWFLRGRNPLALAGFAIVVAAQFLAGNAETSVHVLIALALYLVIRAAAAGREALLLLVALGLSGALGALLAGIQLVPFLDELRRSTLTSARGARQAGLGHLKLSAAASWLVPNAHGNPGIDGLPGREPNYNEATGFAGVGALVLSPFALFWAWARERSPVVGLAAIGILSAASAYGPANTILGRLPILALLNNGRFWVVTCFAVAAAAGLGLDVLIERGGGTWRPASALAIAAGSIGLAGLVAAGLLLLALWAKVDELLPPVHTWFGFWVAVGLISFGVAVAFVAAGLLRAPVNAVTTGLATLVLIEGALFAGPFNPRVPASEVPPHSDAIAWLQANASDTYVAATGVTLTPETATLYGLHDARGTEIAGLTPRLRGYWQMADPDYSDETYRTQLEQPGAAWLAAAGVGYVITPMGDGLPGTSWVYSGEGVEIARVPDARPFAFVPGGIVKVGGEAEARAWLAENGPLDPVVVEQCCGEKTVEPSSARVRVLRRDLDRTELQVTAPAPVTVVVLESYWPGWIATVDGREVPIAPADLHFQAVDVPGGRHDVVLSYRPANVAAGQAVSGAGLAVLCLLIVVGLRRRRFGLARATRG